MSRVNEPTLENCAEFDGYVRKWQKILNLCDWRIERAGKMCAKNMAEVSFDPGARLAVYKIGQSFGAADVTSAALEETALHELLHVLLYDLTNAESSTLESAEHRVINVLEKLLIKGSHEA